jgi:hypothetical protein
MLEDFPGTREGFQSPNSGATSLPDGVTNDETRWFT